MGNSGNYRGDQDDVLVKGEDTGTGLGDNILSHEQRLYTTLVGENGDRVSVTPDGFGANRMATDSVVTVVSQLGFDDIADTWFAIGLFTDSTGVGGAGDDIRVQIAAGDDATRYPAVDVTYTITAGDVADPFPEIEVATNVAAALNADATFKDQWTADTVKDNGIVHITSDLKAEMGERTGAGDFSVTPTGTTTISLGTGSIIERQNKTTSLARDAEDPRIGILGISGNVLVTPGAIGDLHLGTAKNGGSSDMLVNGSVTPVVFKIPAIADHDIFISEMRFYGGGNGIQYTKFLSRAALTNGITLDIKSDDVNVSYPFSIKTTEDFKNKFAWGTAGNWALDLVSGTDQFLATWVFDNPFPLRAVGTFPTDDALCVNINDNLTSGIAELEFAAFGFSKDV